LGIKWGCMCAGKSSGFKTLRPQMILDLLCAVSHPPLTIDQ
jgi:hypothetical protein